MTSDKSQNNIHDSSYSASSDEPACPDASTSRLDTEKRDRFELLSAYLDGEVTAAERQQVEAWLTHDVAVQRLYHRLLKLRQGMHTLPIPTTARSTEQTVEQVLTRINRRSKAAWAWGGAAIAAVLVGAISSIMPSNPLVQQIAQFKDPARSASWINPMGSPSPHVDSDALMIALDRPVLEIPKAPLSAPTQTRPSIHPDSRNVR